MTEPTCALWYWSHHSVFVELCDDEQEAAESAVSLQESEQGAPAGIQFADGRYLDRDEWPAFGAEESRRYQQWRDEEEQREPRPRPATREVTPPFETSYGQKATVLADAPSWLGRQIAPSSREQPPPPPPGSAGSGGGTDEESRRGDR
jgi:hypothetical protein